MKKQSTMIACALAVVSGVLLCLGGCNQSPEVVIYSNADEAVSYTHLTLPTKA